MDDYHFFLGLGLVLVAFVCSPDDVLSEGAFSKHSSLKIFTISTRFKFAVLNIAFSPSSERKDRQTHFINGFLVKYKSIY